MNRILATLAALIVAAGCAKPAEPAGPAAPPANSVEILKQIERDTATRWRAKDAAFFEALFVDAFVWISTMEPQVQDRARFLADLKKDYTVELAEMGEPTVILMGTTAAVYGKAHNRGTFEGVPFDAEFVYHDTFTWDGKAWRALATSSVPVPKAAGPAAVAPAPATPAP